MTKKRPINWIKIFSETFTKVVYPHSFLHRHNFRAKWLSCHWCLKFNRFMPRVFSGPRQTGQTQFRWRRRLIRIYTVYIQDFFSFFFFKKKNDNAQKHLTKVRSTLVLPVWHCMGTLQGSLEQNYLFVPVQVWGFVIVKTDPPAFRISNLGNQVQTFRLFL